MKEANAFNPAAAAAAAEYSGPGNGGLVGSPGYGQQVGGESSADKADMLAVR